MSGLTIQALVSLYRRGTIDRVQCLTAVDYGESKSKFTQGEYYVVENDEVYGDDDVKYSSTMSKFGNPTFKKDKTGKLGLGRTNLKDINKPEDSGGSCNYYKVLIENPTTAEEPYTSECNDVIEALDMTYAEANMFKEIWRSAAARTLGKLKAGHNEVRGAEKIEFFAKRNAIQKGVK